MPQNFKTQVKSIYRLLLSLFCFLGIIIIGFLLFLNHNIKPTLDNNYTQSPIEIDEDKIENGIHIRTGFVEAEGLMTVVNNCTNCHSAKLVTQNRMSKESWIATIKWMQETQNLWDLGKNQDIIVNYLALNYAPNKTGRREILKNIDWYELED